MELALVCGFRLLLVCIWYHEHLWSTPKNVAEPIWISRRSDAGDYSADRTYVFLRVNISSSPIIKLKRLPPMATAYLSESYPPYVSLLYYTEHVFYKSPFQPAINASWGARGAVVFMFESLIPTRVDVYTWEYLPILELAVGRLWQWLIDQTYLPAILWPPFPGISKWYRLLRALSLLQWKQG